MSGRVVAGWLRRAAVSVAPYARAVAYSLWSVVAAGRGRNLFPGREPVLSERALLPAARVVEAVLRAAPPSHPFCA
jgi:hypothetical protein